MKRLYLLWLVVVSIAFFYLGEKYGRTHRSRREEFEYIWQSGQGFAHGWSACEESFGIKFVNTNGWCGWICTRAAGNVPPGFTLEFGATNTYEEEVKRFGRKTKLPKELE